MDLQSQTVLNQEAWNLIGSDPRKALRLSLDNAEQARRDEDGGALVDALVNQAWAHLNLSQNGEALAVFDEALKLARQTEDSDGQLRALDGLGTVYQRFSRFSTALEYFSQALRLARDTDNREKEFVATNAIGEIYRDIGQYQEAFDYFLEAQNLTKKLVSREHHATIKANLGQTCIHLGRHDEALEHLSRALVLYKEIGNRVGEARTLTQIGQIYDLIGELVIAEEYHQECLKICLRLGNKWGQLEAYYNLAVLSRKRRLDPEKVQWFYEKVIALGADTDSKLYSSRGYAGLAEFWEEQAEFEKALHCFQQHMQLDRLLRTESVTQQINNINTQFEYSRSQAEAEILRLKAEALERQSVELRQSYMTISIISEIGKKITAALGIRQLLQNIYAHVKELMDTTIFGVALYSEKRRTINFSIFMENGVELPRFKKDLEAGANFSSWCILNKQSLLIKDVIAESKLYLSKPLEDSLITEHTPRSLVYLPLSLEERTLGLLTVQSYEPGAYTGEHLAILEALGGYIAIALANSINHRKVRHLNQELHREKIELVKATDQIRHMAQHDNLTGLPNRRMLSDFLIRTLSYCHRNRLQFAVIYLDLDGFKPVNDSLGHEAGDAVLIEVAGRLTAALRESDLVARVGGDEFVAVAQEVVGREGAAAVAGRILDKLSQPIRIRDQEFILGASIGISIFPDDGADPELLVHAADTAMYKVKKAGKNAFGFSGPPPPSQAAPSGPAEAKPIKARPDPKPKRQTKK